MPHHLLPWFVGAGAPLCLSMCQLTEIQQDKFMWATALVGSRALTLRGERFLVPFADVCNYAADSVRLMSLE